MVIQKPKENISKRMKWSAELNMLRTGDEGQEMAIGFGLKEVSGKPHGSREVSKIEMAVVDNSLERLCHEGKSWNKIWFLKEYFSVGGRSLCSPF